MEAAAGTETSAGAAAACVRAEAEASAAAAAVVMLAGADTAEPSLDGMSRSRCEGTLMPDTMGFSILFEAWLSEYWLLVRPVVAAAVTPVQGSRGKGTAHVLTIQSDCQGPDHRPVPDCLRLYCCKHCTRCLHSTGCWCDTRTQTPAHCWCYLFTELSNQHPSSHLCSLQRIVSTNSDVTGGGGLYWFVVWSGVQSASLYSHHPCESVNSHRAPIRGLVVTELPHNRLNPCTCTTYRAFPTILTNTHTHAVLANPPVCSDVMVVAWVSMEWWSMSSTVTDIS